MIRFEKIELNEYTEWVEIAKSERTAIECIAVDRVIEELDRSLCDVEPENVGITLVDVSKLGNWGNYYWTPHFDFRVKIENNFYILEEIHIAKDNIIISVFEVNKEYDYWDNEEVEKAIEKAEYDNIFYRVNYR